MKKRYISVGRMFLILELLELLAEAFPDNSVSISVKETEVNGMGFIRSITWNNDFLEEV